MQSSMLDEYREDSGSGFESACHIFLGGLNGAGYGQVRKPVEGTRLAHLAAWRSANGPVATGYQLDHRCRVRVCCRVEHLDMVSPIENLKRRQMPSRLNLVHTGRLTIGGLCRKGKHEIGPKDLSVGRCRACKALSQLRGHARSLAAQRGDWDTFHRLATQPPPIPSTEWSG